MIILFGKSFALDVFLRVFPYERSIGVNGVVDRLDDQRDVGVQLPDPSDDPVYIFI